jgi:hypothetical protein
MKHLLLTLLVFSMISLSVFAKERIALVIGNSHYRVSPLANPVNDARDIAQVLGELGFDVTLKVDADQMTMESAIEAFGKKLHKNAVGLFYFSGHGAQYAGENYLIPLNSIHKTSAAEHLRYKAVPAGYVLGTMQAADNSLNIVILDACRDNPFKGFSKSLGQGLTRMKGAEGSLIAYATAPGTAAWSGEAGERNSPYTKHLLRFMKQPRLSIESMLKKVRRAVIKETRNTRTVQKPWYEASISDEFYFNNAHPTPVIGIGRTQTPRANLPEIKVVNYTDGSRYEGQFIGQTKNGLGIMTWPSGSRYGGEWKNDKRNGQGIMTLPSGEHYEGEFVNGKRNGQGINIWPNGIRYEGEFVNNKMNGQGIMTWPDGQRYEGEFIDDKKNGHGRMTWPNGNRYEGEWKNGKRNGQGIYTWGKGTKWYGDKYEGDFVDDKFTGQGIYTWANGKHYEGKFIDDKRNGQGIMTWPSGKRYEGEWKNDRGNGQGIMTWPDGQRYEGEWRNGEMSGW